MYFAYLLVTDGFITACFSPEMKRAAAEQSPVEEEKEFRCQNWNHIKGRVPEGPHPGFTCGPLQCPLCFSRAYSCEECR